MGAQVVAEDDLLLVLLVCKLVHVDLMSSPDAVVALAAQRLVGALAEVYAAGDAELAEALVSDLHQRGDAVKRVDERSQVDGDVDDRLGGDTRDGGASDVLNVPRPFADDSLQTRPLVFEHLRPTRIVIGEIDVGRPLSTRWFEHRLYELGLGV